MDSIGFGGMKLIQGNGFRYGVDAVLLAAFTAGETGGRGMKRRRAPRILELGCGNGIVSLILSHKIPESTMLGMEIQTKEAERARRNARLNHLEERISIVEGDIKEAGTLFASASFHVVTSNPPYMIEHHGLVNPDNAKMIARHEVYCTLEDIIVQTAKLLKNSGKFYLVHRPFRLAEIFYLLVKYGLEPKRMQMVHPYIDKEPNMVLIEAMKGAKSRITCEPPLIVYEKPGVYTKQIYDIYGYNDARVKEHSER